MKYIILLFIISQIAATTYFGEFIECGLYDKCKLEYNLCQGDTVCKYNMYSSPCMEPCGVSYEKFFAQMRNYNQTFNNEEILALFPEASCNFQTCQETWLAKLKNENLTKLKKCEIEKCTFAYPAYTFIAHAFKEINTCRPQLVACIDNDPQCLKEIVKAEKCLSDKGLNVDPRTTPNKYFNEHISGYMPGIEACYPDPQVVRIDDYTKLMTCMAQVWNN